MKFLPGILLLIFLVGCNDDCKNPANPNAENCNLDPVAGPCDALITKYYFDKSEGKCKEFVWGGCGGVVPFHTLAACNESNCSQN